MILSGRTHAGPPDVVTRSRLTTAGSALLLLVSIGTSQNSLMPKSVAGSGGAAGTSSSYLLNCTAGQAVQGFGAGTGLFGYWGFWYGMDIGAAGDVGVTAIIAPAPFVDTMAHVLPTASWHNYRGEEAVFTAFFFLESPTRGREYSRTITVAGLGAGRDTLLEFPVHNIGTDTGTWTATCSTHAPGDTVPGNDRLSRSFSVCARPPWPSGWVEVASMPVLPTGKPVRRGGWLEVNPSTRMMYAQKGYRTSDFYSYDGALDKWTPLARMPYKTHPLWSGKPPGRGSKGCCDGDNVIYVTQGNNTLGFWSYHIAQDSWAILPDVLPGLNRKRVRGGTDMFYVPGDTGFVYLLKGYRSEFFRFNVAGQVWETLDDAPAGVRSKWDKGSWLCGIDSAGGWRIYAHKAKYHELHVYDAAAQAWDTVPKTGMPFVWMTGRKKKSRDGGSAARFGDWLFCLKGGNTQEFWQYDPAADAWTELDTMPALGSTGRRKRVKYGAGIVSFGFGVFFALKGNKTTEMWRYVLPAVSEWRPQRSGVAEGVPRPGWSGLRVTPNPLADGIATVAWQFEDAALSLRTTERGRCLMGTVRQRRGNPGAPAIKVFDIAGREVLVTRSLDNSVSGTLLLDLGHLPAGVYLVRFEAGGFVSTQKLAVQH